MARTKAYKNEGGRKVFHFRARPDLVVPAGATVETSVPREQAALKNEGLEEVRVLKKD